MNYDPAYLTGEAYGLSETAVYEISSEYNLFSSYGLYVPDSASYEELIQKCDAQNLNPNGSIREILEEQGTPDFKNQVLCVMLDTHIVDTEYKWYRTELRQDKIYMGSSLKMNRTSDEPQEGALAYIWLPRKYLTEETYTVICRNR